MEVLIIRQVMQKQQEKIMESAKSVLEPLLSVTVCPSHRMGALFFITTNQCFSTVSAAELFITERKLFV